MTVFVLTGADFQQQLTTPALLKLRTTTKFYNLSKKTEYKHANK